MREGAVLVCLLHQEKLAKEYRRPVAWYADKACFGDNADAATPCPIALEDGCRIDKGTAFELQGIHKLPHTLAHHVVVVPSLCIKADGRLLTLGHEVEGKADDGLYARHEEVGVEAHPDIAPHIVHVATKVKLQPMAEAVGKRFGHGFRLCQPTCDKAQAHGLGFDVFAI